MDNQVLIKLQTWMSETIAAQAWNRLNDVHVDELSSKFKPRSNWVMASYEAFKSAVIIKKTMNWNTFRIAVSIRLEESPNPQLYTFNNLQEVQESLHPYTPPSLYLFPESFPSWESSVQKGVVQPQLLFDTDIECCFYRQWYDTEDQVYCSTLWISSHIKD